MDVLYKCDRRACETCNPDNNCCHTHDISHAVDFEIRGGAYFQKVPEPTISNSYSILDDGVATFYSEGSDRPNISTAGSGGNGQKLMDELKSNHQSIIIKGE